MAVIETQGFKLDNSGKRVVVDPITRIEGHLRIEVNLDDKNVIRNAVSTGTMWRGLEVILKGRDPRDAWAFTERICGVCTTVHALASIRAVEDALAIRVPRNADIIRNIMFLTQMVQDHVIHFYHLHALDWVDVVSALSADPAATASLNQQVSSRWPRSSNTREDRERRLKRAVEEIREYKMYDYVIVNDLLTSSLRKFESIVLAERQRSAKKDSAWIEKNIIRR